MVSERAAGILLFDRPLAHGLLIEDLQGRWRFPAGRALDGEAFRDAAIRELWEEAGIAENQFRIMAPAIPMISLLDCPRRGKISKATCLFPAVLVEDRLPSLRRDAGAARDARFIPVTELEKVTASRGRVAALTLAYSALRAALFTGGVEIGL